jgi:hypothetical protein
VSDKWAKQFADLAEKYPDGAFGHSTPIKLKYRSTPRIKQCGSKPGGNSGNVGRRHRRRQRAPR